MKELSIVGDLINFRGLVYAPVNENGVIFLFGKIADDLNMYIEEIKPGFPDCIARRFVGKGWERIRIEFEFKSSNFVQHQHIVEDCDIIVCWEHDWKNCPLEVIELKTEIQGLENWPIQKPNEKESSTNVQQNIDLLQKWFEEANSGPKVREWYNSLYEMLTGYNDTVWAKIGQKYIGWYSPQRAFASFRSRKTTLMIKCFCGESVIEGTEISNVKYSPRWCKFTIKSDKDLTKVFEILKESLKRITTAINAGESTSYFSGGQKFGQAEVDMDDED